MHIFRTCRSFFFANYLRREENLNNNALTGIFFPFAGSTLLSVASFDELFVKLDLGFERWLFCEFSAHLLLFWYCFSWVSFDWSKSGLIENLKKINFH